ncbi:MAG: hypothetical protein IPK72_22245 [Candidatus Eisenbacteria bacterium]|nr:hypothetical protein [Candidatus Eisenbacteria bacterium]
MEGMEGDVIRGQRLEPKPARVVVVEATRPMSQEESHQDWEPDLVAARYQFAYADGLNRFYVSESVQRPSSPPSGIRRTASTTSSPRAFSGPRSFAPGRDPAADATELARKEALRASAAEIRAEAANRAVEAEERAGAAGQRAEAAETRSRERGRARPSRGQAGHRSRRRCRGSSS